MPGALAAEVLNDTTVRLTWTASSDNAGVAGYQLIESNAIVGTTTGTVYRHEGLAPQTDYRYRVRAYDAAGNVSGATPLVSVNTGDNHRPATPEGLAAEVLNDQTIALTWLPASDNVATTGYRLYNRGEPIADVATTHFTHGNLTPLTVYRYTVRAFDAAGNLSLEQPQLVVNTGDSTAPDTPEGFAAEVLSDSRISLSWQPSSDNVGAPGYRIFADGAALIDTSATSFVHTGLAPVSAYTYAVAAVDASGNVSAPSPSVSLNTGDTTAPSAPLGLSAQVVNDRRIHLSWLPANDNVAVTGYRLFDRGEPIADVVGLTFAHLRLRAGTVYRYAVKAFDAHGNFSSQEPQLVVSTGDTTPPLPPTELEVLERGETEVKIRWQPARDNVAVTGYRVFEDDELIAEVNDRFFVIHGGLTVDTTYRFSVLAYDALDNESALSTLSYTAPDNTRPDAPLNVEAEVLDDSRVQLTWSAASDNVGVTHYQVLDAGTIVGESGGTKFRHVGLAPVSAHKYKVKAVDAAGNASPAAAEVLVNTGDTTAPATPPGFVATVLDDATVQLSWQPAADNVETRGYRLYESGALLADLALPGYLHGQLAPVTEYRYSLVAYDAAGNASPGTAIQAVNTGDTTPPSVPGAFSLTLIDNATLDLAWLPSTDNVQLAGYEVLSDGQVIATPSSAGARLEGLPASVARSYSVRAVDHAGLASAATFPLRAAPDDDTDVPRLDAPLTPLMAYLNVGDRDDADQAVSAQELVGIAANYAAMQVQPNTQLPAAQLDLLRSRNPAFRVLTYMNSSHTRSTPGHLALAEMQRMQMINVYLEGYLNEAVGPADSALSIRPADVERGWGLIPSTLPGSISAGATEYVTYVRIGNELMRIEAVDADTGRVTVTRGFDGTPTAAHAADAAVLAPVYTGPGRDGELDPYLPGNDRGFVPMYSLQVGSPPAAAYFADQVSELIAEGADGGWLDICSPEFFNQVNAVGARVVPWNVETGAPFTPDDRRLHQDRKLAIMQQIVLSTTGRWPALAANNNADGKYFAERGRAMDFLLPTDVKPVPIDAVVLEAVYSRLADGNFFSEGRWQRNLSTIIHGAQQGLPVWPWIKSATTDYRPDTVAAERFERYDYASVLLGFEHGSGALVVLPLFADDAGGRRLNLPDWLFYDLGEPLESVAYDALDGLRVDGTQSFRRRWTGGVVLVNPTGQDDASVPLEGQYLVPGARQKVSSIPVPAHTGLLLIADQ
ncbi:MAG: hypothetical protein AAGD86_01140 [Pseudomonadota bacterium]